jgi:hypothetical protein
VKASKNTIVSRVSIIAVVLGLYLVLSIVTIVAAFGTLLQSNNNNNINPIIAITTISTTTNSSNDPVIMHIDAAISAIKSGDSDGARKQLLEAEKLLEGVESAIDAEKRVEAAIKALKDGDSNGSINHAEEAKKLLRRA